MREGSRYRRRLDVFGAPISLVCLHEPHIRHMAMERDGFIHGSKKKTVEIRYARAVIFVLLSSHDGAYCHPFAQTLLSRV